MTKTIVPLLEEIPHLRYCEPFGGGASCLLAKRPVQVETYNDIDAGLHGFFTVLADPDQFEQFHRIVEALPYSRRLYDEWRAGWRDEPDPIRRAAMWFVVARQSFSGQFGSSWGSVVTSPNGSMARTCADWISAIDRLPAVHRRLRRVQIENADWRVILERYDTPETLFYLDPPYTHGQRRSGKYDHELTDADHVELVDALLAITGSAVLSGYDDGSYDRLVEAGWTRRSFDVACYAVGRTRAAGLLGKGACENGQRRTECLWIKPYHAGLFGNQENQP